MKKIIILFLPFMLACVFTLLGYAITSLANFIIGCEVSIFIFLLLCIGFFILFLVYIGLFLFSIVFLIELLKTLIANFKKSKNEDANDGTTSKE